MESNTTAIIKNFMYTRLPSIDYSVFCYTTQLSNE